VVDALHPEMAEGAGTIGLVFAAASPFDLAVVQIEADALIFGVARWLRATAPQTPIIGVCARGALPWPGALPPASRSPPRAPTRSPPRSR
jgi:threonine dehydratase